MSYTEKELLFIEVLKEKDLEELLSKVFLLPSILMNTIFLQYPKKYLFK